ncbi:hypothetical protein B0T19DRAFT_477290, partial [Cercophora scortea]
IPYLLPSPPPQPLPLLPLPLPSPPLSPTLVLLLRSASEIPSRRRGADNHRKRSPARSEASKAAREIIINGLRLVNNYITGLLQYILARTRYWRSVKVESPSPTVEGKASCRPETAQGRRAEWV